MTKNEALSQVRRAKSSHIRWRAHVQARMAGLDIEEKNAPMHHKDCDFGQWFYREGFKYFGDWQIYQNVDYIHELLHAVYNQLHQVLLENDAARAKAVMEQLEGISVSLLAALDLFEEEIQLAGTDSF